MTSVHSLRVGIPVIGGKGWIGGVSHLEHHVKAVASLPAQERPQLFLIVSGETREGFRLYLPFAEKFDGIICFGTGFSGLADQTGLPVIDVHTWDDLFCKIDFYFPVNFNVIPDRPAASWVHDFQHKYRPDFFSPQDLAIRDELCSRVAAQSRLVYCSSRAVEQDFRKFYPESQAVTRVLPFHILPEDDWYRGDPAAIQEKYGLPDRFILCSNQFWLHKNHRRLFDAIAALRQTGLDVHLACTGMTDDFRRPQYMEELQKHISESGVSDLIHILGLVPRQDQIQLVRRSLFVVQPSLFEGLSLIVQECRSLGKTILLSDLPVHLEHEYGVYFQRENTADLASKISALLPVCLPGPDFKRETEARMQADCLAKIFARSFSDLVVESQAIFSKKQTAAAPANSGNGQEAAIIVATSLVPGGEFCNQYRAVASWLKLGCKIISVNAQEDIPLLKNKFPDIIFIEAKDNVSKYGRPYVFIHEVLAALRRQPAGICGIIPPDVCLFDEHLPGVIAREAANSLVYIGRTDIEPVEAQPAWNIPGAGCLFFPQEIIDKYPHPQEDFCLNLPWYDYWLLLAARENHITIKRFPIPLAYHILHQPRYPQELDVILAHSLEKYAPAPLELTDDTVGKYHQTLSHLLAKHFGVIPYTVG
ncbi:MAG TPA: glycosyltransferase family 1 protein [Methylomusa anaerophila]|uniref:Glycosyl transferases group 1 n=1 Tax=Methylomusa anaerophila TaxID=1930071 RepID=A0A348ALD4_9FIRM|nr:glycosyltransferase family 1 protein [Methylomusa anaerophila]BBB91882.1 glycosyl transferases group 1 [Methylomusa anaerophila]HML88387.1 glycosyltransferase family 1 protein [Methylomusa anaerophila]